MHNCPFSEIDPDDIVLYDDLGSFSFSSAAYEEAIEELRYELDHQIEGSRQKNIWLYELERRIEKLEEAIQK